MAAEESSYLVASSLPTPLNSSLGLTCATVQFAGSANLLSKDRPYPPTSQRPIDEAASRMNVESVSDTSPNLDILRRHTVLHGPKWVHDRPTREMD